MSRRRRQFGGGFSLVEGLIAGAILAAASAAVLLPFSVGARNNRTIVRQSVAVNLAESMIEEIVSKPFYDPQGNSAFGRESGERNRPDFDDCDDYLDYSESAGQLRDSEGHRLDDPSLAPYSRKVSVARVWLPGQSDSEDHGAVRVQVRVFCEGRQEHLLTRMVSRPVAPAVSETPPQSQPDDDDNGDRRHG